MTELYKIKGVKIHPTECIISFDEKKEPKNPQNLIKNKKITPFIDSDSNNKTYEEKTREELNEFIIVFNKNPKDFDTKQVYQQLVKNAKKEILEFLFQKYPYSLYHDSLIYYASEYNNVEFFEWLHKRQGMKDLTSEIFIAPSRFAYFDIFSYLMKLKYKYPEDIMMYVCDSGKLPFIKKIHETFKIKFQEVCLLRSIKNFETFKYLLDNNCPYNLYTVSVLFNNRFKDENSMNQLNLSRKYFEDSLEKNTDLNSDFKSEIHEIIRKFYNSDPYNHEDACIIC